MISVFVIDDHDIVREGIKLLLGKDAELAVVGSAATAHEAVILLKEIEADVIVLDLNLPDDAGIRLFKRIQACAGCAKIVIFSHQPEDDFSLRLLDAGAAAVLNKARSAGELLSAIKHVMRHGRYVTEELAQHEALGERPKPAPHHDFSERQREIFLALAQGATPTQIAATLNLRVGTVTTYIHRIKRKLGVSTLGEVMRYAHLHGLL